MPTSNRITTDYIIEVTRGSIPGQRMNPIGGFNSNLQAGVEETIWDQGGIYTYLTADTALFASSSSASDTMTIAIFGLTRDFTEVVRTVTLTGQTQVALDDVLYRVHAAQVLGATDAIGDIYIAESDTTTAGVPDTETKIKAKIAIFNGISNGVTEMAMFTCPKGVDAHFISDNFLIDKGDDSVFKPIGRTDGGVFVNFGLVPMYQQVVEFTLPGLIVPTGFDTEFRGISGNEGAIGSIFLDIILIDI